MIRLHQSFLDRPIAHRGLHDRAEGRIENAPLSFDAAIENGYGIELDVQLSNDGVAMVFHDYDLGRLTDQSGAVALESSHTLQGIQLKDTSDYITTLDQVLDQIDGKVPVVIEIKDQDGGMGDQVGLLEKAVITCLQQYQGHAAIMSFNPHAMAKVAELTLQWPLGLVTDRFEAQDWPTIPANRRKDLATISDFERLPLSFISHNQSQLNDAAVQRVKESGANVLCWTVRSEENEVNARTVADNITFEGYLA